MVYKIGLIFCIIAVVYSKCQSKPGENLKLCDVPANENFQVHSNGTNVYLRLNDKNLQLRDLTRPLLHLGSQYYHFVSYLKLNYFNAFKFCNNLGMELLNIDDKAENDLIIEHIRTNYAPAKGFWTSGEDLGSPGDFVWLSNGQLISFENWGPGQPDNRNNEEHCLLINRENDNYFWEDSNCWGKHYAICELSRCPYLC